MQTTQQIVRELNKQRSPVKRDYEAWAWLFYGIVLLLIGAGMFYTVYMRNYTDGLIIEHCIVFPDNCIIINK